MLSDGRRPTVQELTRLLDDIAPPELAEPGDRGGLVLGDPGAEVAWVAAALDLVHAGGLPAPADGGTGLVVVHRPPAAPAPGRLVETDPAASVICGAIRRRLSVYVAHTAFAAAPEGLSHLLALALGLDPAGLRPLVPAQGERFVKLVVFVPRDHTAAVRAALGEAGAGWIGNYSHTAFVSAGYGYFRPREGANPFVGAAGELREEPEDRVETILPQRLVSRVVDRLTAAHPYEEPAYDIYPLEGCPPVSRPELMTGLGRVGNLSRSGVTFPACVEAVGRALGLHAGMMRVIPPQRPLVRRLAVVPGEGEPHIAAAAAGGADVYVSGRLRAEGAAQAAELGIGVIDTGRTAIERGFVPAIAARLRKKLATQGISTRVIEVSTPSDWQV